MILIQAKVKQITNQIKIMHNDIDWFTLGIVSPMIQVIKTQTTRGEILETLACIEIKTKPNGKKSMRLRCRVSTSTFLQRS